MKKDLFQMLFFMMFFLGMIFIFISINDFSLGFFAGLFSVVIYGFIEPPTDSAFFMYLIHPTLDAIPASKGGVTNLWPFVSAILGSIIITVAGSKALPDS